MKLFHISGITAGVGGLFYVIKSVTIILGYPQPLLIFELAPLFFLISLLLCILLLDHNNKEIKVSKKIVIFGIILFIFLKILEYFMGNQFPQGEEFVFPISLLIFLESISWMLGMIFLGKYLKKNDTNNLILGNMLYFTGVSFFPLLIIGIILEEIDEVLLEIPIFLFGIAWAYIGFLISNFKFEANDKF